MKVVGNQTGTIQNADTIVNREQITSVISVRTPIEDIQRLSERIAAARATGSIEGRVAEAATRELDTAAAEADPVEARSAVGRARDMLAVAAGAAPLAEAAARIIAMMAGHGPSAA
ncbi:hypothetical protein [Asanoa iriomotensis]|uniref:Uncharacterized protein n=1 Tax=Asanoa iriomotensis TaxID=234613 RepID=A0ABQ4C891_9ACTN|nr:hypothetical protein [Asanoa iriomotensis]GIF58996.1 hypothetical protein Air01nite_50910 [Asanoa iriomotensis]